MSCIRIAALGMCLAVLSSDADAAFSVLRNDIFSQAYDPFVGDDQTVSSDTSLPLINKMLEASINDVSNETLVNLSNVGGQTTLSIDMNHKSNETRGGIANTSVNPLIFQSDVTTTYDLSGHYRVEDSGAPGFVLYSVIFSDITTGTEVSQFYSFQRSQETINEMFVLGQPGGDLSDDLSGSLTGEILAGHTYQLFFVAILQNVEEGGPGATATGSFTLKVGEVPEPSLVAFCAGIAIGVMRLSARRRLRR